MNLLIADAYALLLAAIFVMPAVAVYAMLGHVLPKLTVGLLLLAGTCVILLLALVMP